MMRISRAQARLFGIDSPKPKRAKSPDGMNQTERLFAAVLDQAVRQERVMRWWREPLTFRLAGNTRYTPDFLVVPRIWTDWRLSIVEVKGWMRDDAAVKIKVAADMYPCFTWWLAYRAKGGGWDVRPVTRAGIGRESFHPMQIWGAMD